MAFNFNWSPLMADSSFYQRAQDLLTAALNKSPKPPIIIDDIVVTELNLGSIPPELEILEIGDLAEDRFRGIFKMSYKGDAYLTLKTVVQANPLTTYLQTRNEFTSMKPLAADAGLTIPLQITLSEFHLSGFVILVFSKQKGLTVVFRNDPLESLKVSSTFDSIPFVRDFLQKAIEGQLRQLFMDELPAIIHRLSLRLWVPEYKTILDREDLEDSQPHPQSQPSPQPHLHLPPQDPFLNPPSDPVDSAGHVLTSSEIGALSLDSSVEMHSLFSQKNLLRLAALADSQRTLSLFTPSVAEAAFRACASVNNADCIADANASGYTAAAAAIPIPAASGSAAGLGLHGYSYGYGASSPSLALSRTVSQAQCQQLLPDSASASASASMAGSYSSRQSVSGWSGYGLNLGAGRHAHGKHGANKKKKRRVVDLRKTTTTTATAAASEAEEKQKQKQKEVVEDKEMKTPMIAEPTDTESEAAEGAEAASVPSGECDVIAEESQEQMITPRRRSSTEKKKKTMSRIEGVETHLSPRTPCYTGPSPSTANINDFYISSDRHHQRTHTQPPPPPPPQFNFPSSAPLSPYTTDYNAAAAANAAANAAAYSSYFGYNPYAAGQNIGTGTGTGGDSNSGILEQALMMKMAGELARRMQQQQPKGGEGSEKARGRMSEGEGEGEGIPPPPPYRQ